jgi:hypothetical protein
MNDHQGMSRQTNGNDHKELVEHIVTASAGCTDIHDSYDHGTNNGTESDTAATSRESVNSDRKQGGKRRRSASNASRTESRRISASFRTNSEGAIGNSIQLSNHPNGTLSTFVSQTIFEI